MTRTRDQVLDAIHERRELLRRLGVRRLGLFGSIARDEATDNSDMDFVVDLDPKTFDTYTDVKFFLEDLFGCKVDLVLTDAIKPQLRAAILQDMVDAPGF